MKSECLTEEVPNLVYAEQVNASQKYGKTNHSDHESYAIILEEYEECQEEMNDIKDSMVDFWKAVRNDDKEPEKLWALKDMSKSCYNLIYEAIQLAGVVDKAINSICERGAV